MRNTIKRVFLIGLSLVTIILLTVSVASAAQGQNTEVNPSGIGFSNGASGGKSTAALAQSQASVLSTSLGGTIAPPPDGN